MVINFDTDLSPEVGGGGRVGTSCIWEDSFVLAAVCCCTRTSAASAKCINVFLSGLSSKFLQPTHLQIDEHKILAYNNSLVTMLKLLNLCFKE